MGAIKGWSVTNNAVSGSLCSDLSTGPIWDSVIDGSSVSAYAHFHNEQANWGAEGATWARGCIEAETAWLAIPENQKVRAIDAQQAGATWTAGPNSAAITLDGGTLTFSVTGTTVYLATARGFGVATYTVSVDGNLVTDPDSLTTTFNQGIDASVVMPNLIRVKPQSGTTHTIVYTCTNPGGVGCIVFYAAGVGSLTHIPVYSVSPFPNASWNTQYNFDAATCQLYRDAWTSLVKEVQGDGLDIIPVDILKSGYDPERQTQLDGIHETAEGHAVIGNYVATLQ